MIFSKYCVNDKVFPKKVIYLPNVNVYINIGQVTIKNELLTKLS